MSRIGRWTTNRVPVDLAAVVWPWLGVRVALSMLGILLALSGGLPRPCSVDIDANGWATLPPLADHGLAFGIVGVWERWDACWYAKIATWGYEADEASTNFFPLFPVVTAVASAALPGDVNAAGLLVNALAVLGGLVGLRRLVSADFDIETADRAVRYQLLLPSAVFLFAPFAEALLLITSVWALCWARRRRWVLAGLAALLASLDRPFGLLLALPLGWEAALAIRDRWRAGTGLAPSDLFPVMAALAPVAGYLGWLAVSGMVGQPYFAAHGSWPGAASPLIPPWVTIAAAWRAVVEDRDAITLANLVAISALLGVVLAAARRMPVSYSLLAIPQLVLILSTGAMYPLMSSMRYAAPLFPTVVALALAGRSRWFDGIWLPISATLLGLFATLFVQGRFIG